MKIGDYVRTKDGFIAKLIKKDDWYKFDGVILEEEYTYNYLSKEHAEELIIKSSPNLIDLIEVGDYVNGYKITDFTEIDKYNDEKILYADLNVNVSSEYIAIHENEIKSIVTKEMFANAEYRVEKKLYY